MQAVDVILHKLSCGLQRLYTYYIGEHLASKYDIPAVGEKDAPSHLCLQYAGGGRGAGGEV